MAEFKYVELPSVGKQVRSDERNEYANAELAEVWVAQGWEPISVSRTSSIGHIGFLLRRD